MEINAHTMQQPVTAMQRGGKNEGTDKDKSNRPGELPQDEQRQVDKLQERDREVRAHEAAHVAAAGGHAQGGAQFTYTRGPDGRLYASGGEVSIDTSAVAGDPQATLQKAQTVQRAALAPAEPSGQDRQVAAQAAAMAAQARQEMASTQREETGNGETGVDPQADAAADLLERIRADGGLESRFTEPLHLVT